MQAANKTTQTTESTPASSLESMPKMQEQNPSPTSTTPIQEKSWLTRQRQRFPWLFNQTYVLVGGIAFSLLGGILYLATALWYNRLAVPVMTSYIWLGLAAAPYFRYALQLSTQLHIWFSQTLVVISAVAILNLFYPYNFWILSSDQSNAFLQLVYFLAHLAFILLLASFLSFFQAPANPQVSTKINKHSLQETMLSALWLLPLGVTLLWLTQLVSWTDTNNIEQGLIQEESTATVASHNSLSILYPSLSNPSFTAVTIVLFLLFIAASYSRILNAKFLNKAEIIGALVILCAFASWNYLPGFSYSTSGQLIIIACCWFYTTLRPNVNSIYARNKYVQMINRGLYWLAWVLGIALTCKLLLHVNYLAANFNLPFNLSLIYSGLSLVIVTFMINVLAAVTTPKLNLLAAALMLLALILVLCLPVISKAYFTSLGQGISAPFLNPPYS